MKKKTPTNISLFSQFFLKNLILIAKMAVDLANDSSSDGGYTSEFEEHMDNDVELLKDW